SPINYCAARYRRFLVQRHRGCSGYFGRYCQITSRKSPWGFETGTDALFVGTAPLRFFAMRSMDCSSAQKLMSPFIDSMVTRLEAEELELHVGICQPCRRQLQSYKSMRSLLAGVDEPAVPEDM